MTQILHIIQQLSKGGAARSMIATAKYSAQYGDFHHQVISLLPSETLAKQQAEAVGMLVIDKPHRQDILNAIEKADIVHVHWWNNPHLYDLLRSDLPSMRLLTWFHVAGDQPPHVITKQLVDNSDFVIPCNPYSYNLPIFNKLPPEIRKEKVGMVYDATDFQRIGEFEKRTHKGFNVGYIGTVDFVKMHPNYVSMSAKVNIPDVRFIVCGGGISDYLAQQAQQLGASDKFDFRGYVEDIKSVLEILDVYGYPLCEETYAAAELNLQEVMYCAIPPVVFPYGGVKNLIQHNETGLIVNSEKEYKEAIEYLYYHPQERQRLGNNARKYALEIFGAENAGKAINPIYEKLMQHPKRDRIWGIPVGTSLLNLPITLEDLTGEYRQPTPAELFIEGLGGTKSEFIVSMTSQDINELFEAEEKIAFSSPLVRSAGSGGIIHYCNSYPNDGYLRLWTGLVLEASQQYPQAIQNYISAINLGCNHWRVAWYLARVAEKANDLELAEKAVRNVLQGVPNFINAQELLENITNRNLFPINFQTLNLIIFPDWQQDEETLSLTLTEVLRAIASHPQAEEVTLIIDITNAENEEDAQMLVSAVTMNLILEEGIELPETTEIAFIANLTSQEWEKLFNLVQYRVKLDTEYLPIYIEKLSSCQIQDISNLSKTISESDLLDISFQSLNLIIFPDWQQDEETLLLNLAEVLRAIASHPQVEEITLIIDITNTESEEDAQMLVSGVTMNLMLEEEIELPETTQIAFISNLTTEQEKYLAKQLNYQINLSSENKSSIKGLNTCSLEEVKTLNLSRVSSPLILTDDPVLPKIDVVLQSCGTHGWNMWRGWVNVLAKQGLLHRVFAPIANWNDQTPINDDGLWEYLEKPTGDIMLLSGFDWHSQPLHRSPQWQERWQQAKIEKIALLQENYSAQVTQNNSQWQEQMLRAITTASQCVDRIICHHEPDVQFLKDNYQLTVPIKFLSFAIDPQFFRTKKPFYDKINQAGFRGNISAYFSNSTYSKRRELIEILRNSGEVDILEYTYQSVDKNEFISTDGVENYSNFLNKYRIQLNLPSISQTLTNRPVEVMACGGVLLQNHIIGEESKTFFEDGKHLIFYDENNPENLINIIKDFKNNPDLAEKIAKDGQKICYEHHTLFDRVISILDWLNYDIKTQLKPDLLKFMI